MRGLFREIGLFFLELRECSRLFRDRNRLLRRLVFYSESAIYYQYYEPYINYILEHSNFDICYLTSAADDPVFRSPEKRIKPFYINIFLNAVLSWLDSRVIVMTMPGLGLYHIKKPSAGRADYIYLFHAIGSTHFSYEPGAFDHYDTIFCVGSYDFEEIRRTESLFNLKPKELVRCGYARLEKIYRDHQKYAFTQKDGVKAILIAPTWRPGNILECCLGQLVQALRAGPYKVIIRPHPEFVRRNKGAVACIAASIKKFPQLMLELDFLNDISLHCSDALITDWSGIAFEYAFGTERPVLFIDAPVKAKNPDYQKLGIVPLEVSLRDKIGKNIEVSQAPDIKTHLNELWQGGDSFRDEIIKQREKVVSRWLSSAEQGGRHIIQSCSR